MNNVTQGRLQSEHVKAQKNHEYIREIAVFLTEGLNGKYCSELCLMDIGQSFGLRKASVMFSPIFMIGKNER